MADERFELEAEEKDILSGKVKVLEVRELRIRGYRAIAKNVEKVNVEVGKGIKVVEKGELDRLEVEYA